MAAHNRPSVLKRARETQRMDKKQEKEARRAAQIAARAERPQVEDGEDPDLAGIVPGPQPIRHDQY